MEAVAVRVTDLNFALLLDHCRVELEANESSFCISIGPVLPLHLRSNGVNTTGGGGWVRVESCQCKTHLLPQVVLTPSRRSETQASLEYNHRSIIGTTVKGRAVTMAHILIATLGASQLVCDLQIRG
jgi:hypothetical protein